MKKTEKHIKVTPSALGAIGFWAGADHYGLGSAVRRAPLLVPLDGVRRIFRIAFSDLPGFREDRFLLEYNSGDRECVAILECLPTELAGHRTEKLSPWGAVKRYLDLFRLEPTAMFLPLALPIGIVLVMMGFGLWSDFVLHNREVLGFFARPGCDAVCVEKVLRLHSLVGLLFFLQLFLLLTPFLFLFFHAPRFRYAFNFRITQTYSLATAILGVFVFAQLLVFFPFKQYGRFLALGLDPKVERVLHHLKDQKE